MINTSHKPFMRGFTCALPAILFGSFPEISIYLFLLLIQPIASCVCIAIVKLDLLI